MVLYATVNTNAIRNNRMLLNDVRHKNGALFRDHCWVSITTELEQCLPGVIYQASADVHIYALGSKVSLCNLHNIKDPIVALEVIRRHNTVIISTDNSPVAMTDVENLLPQEVSDKVVEVNHTPTTLSITFNEHIDAVSYKGYIKRSINEDKGFQETLSEFNAPWKVAAPTQPTSQEEFLVELSLPKAVNAFRQYPDINTIQVEGMMSINRSILSLIGKRLKAVKSGPNYNVEGHTVSENMLRPVIEKLQGELVTTSVMDPANFIGIDGEYILTVINETNTSVHQSLISRHGEVFLIEKKGNDYVQVGTDLPIPPTILNIRTLRS